MVNVILKFGAYEAHGILKYRPERLYILIGKLLSEGLEVQIYPWIHVNRLGIFVAGRLIFTCRLTFLSLFECNQTCSLAIRKVLEAVEAVYHYKKLTVKLSEDGIPKHHEGIVHFASTHRSLTNRNEQNSILKECEIPIDLNNGISTDDTLTDSGKSITPDIVASEDESIKINLLDE